MIESVKEIEIREVLPLLKEGKKIRVKARNDEFVEITDYVDKGFLDTYEIKLENGNCIKVSKEHKFFTNAGWVEQKDLRIDEHKIYCDDGQYYSISYINYIGKHKIVDITVDSDEHAYFGNGILNHNTGKSLLAASAVAETQKLGGTAVYIDTENAISSEFWTSFGVDTKKMMHIPAETIEDVFDHIEKIVTIVRKSSEDKLLTIVIDSVAGASCRTELESEHGKDGYATTKSIVISKALRKITNMLGKKRVLTIFTNQLRQNLNATTFGDKWITPGGKALPFHSSVRIRLSTIKKLKDKDGQEIGCVCQAKIVKNRMGPPNRVVTFDIYYDSGIADYASWIKVLKEKKIIRQAGAYCKYTKDSGEEIQFQTGTFVEMMESDDELKAEIYGKICDALIMKYKTPNSQVIDTVEVDDEDEEVVE